VRVPNVVQTGKQSPFFIAGFIPTVLYLSFIGLPLVGLVLKAITSEGLIDALTGSLVIDAMLVTLVSSLTTVVIIFIVGTPLAYVIARAQFPGKRIVDITIEFPLVLPPTVAGLGLLMIFGADGFIGKMFSFFGIDIPFTIVAVILAQTFVAAPFYIRSARIGFESINPMYEHLSRTLGRSKIFTFWHVSFPLALRSIIAGLTLAWARAISEVGATIVFAGNFPGRTQTLSLSVIAGLEISLSFALAVSLLLISIAVGILVVINIIANQTKWRSY